MVSIAKDVLAWVVTKSSFWPPLLTRVRHTALRAKNNIFIIITVEHPLWKGNETQQSLQNFTTKG